MKEKVQVWFIAHNQANELRVLVFQTNFKRGGFFQPVTGKVEPGELIIDAALREAEEETGLKNVPKTIPVGYEFQFEDRGQQNHETVFLIHLDQELTDYKISIDPNEHQGYSWDSIETARSKIKFETNQTGLAHALQKLNA